MKKRKIFAKQGLSHNRAGTRSRAARKFDAVNLDRALRDAEDGRWTIDAIPPFKCKPRGTSKELNSAVEKILAIAPKADVSALKEQVIQLAWAYNGQTLAHESPPTRAAIRNSLIEVRDSFAHAALSLANLDDISLEHLFGNSIPFAPPLFPATFLKDKQFDTHFRQAFSDRIEDADTKQWLAETFGGECENDSTSPPSRIDNVRPLIKRAAALSNLVSRALELMPQNRGGAGSALQAAVGSPKLNLVTSCWDLFYDDYGGSILGASLGEGDFGDFVRAVLLYAVGEYGDEDEKHSKGLDKEIRRVANRSDHHTFQDRTIEAHKRLYPEKPRN